MKTLNVASARNRFSQLVDEVHESGGILDVPHGCGNGHEPVLSILQNVAILYHMLLTRQGTVPR